MRSNFPEYNLLVNNVFVHPSVYPICKNRLKWTKHTDISNGSELGANGRTADRSLIFIYLIVEISCFNLRVLSFLWIRYFKLVSTWVTSVKNAKETCRRETKEICSELNARSFSWWLCQFVAWWFVACHFRTTENPLWRCKSCQVLRRKSLQVESSIETTTNEDMMKFLRKFEGGNGNSDNIIGKGAWKICWIVPRKNSSCEKLRFSLRIWITMKRILKQYSKRMSV